MRKVLFTVEEVLERLGCLPQPRQILVDETHVIAQKRVPLIGQVVLAQFFQQFSFTLAADMKVPCAYRFVIEIEPSKFWSPDIEAGLTGKTLCRSSGCCSKCCP
jgi:hypothetical protein